MTRPASHPLKEWTVETLSRASPKANAVLWACEIRHGGASPSASGDSISAPVRLTANTWLVLTWCSARSRTSASPIALVRDHDRHVSRAIVRLRLPGSEDAQHACGRECRRCRRRSSTRLRPVQGDPHLPPRAATSAGTSALANLVATSIVDTGRRMAFQGDSRGQSCPRRVGRSRLASSPPRAHTGAARRRRPGRPPALRAPGPGRTSRD